ncbi:stealth family protein [Arthrobacter crystallopoietes]|uniref:Stealth protein CR3, conserved region 3 n=1 Tax=Crystallibacter crystallopoietes TaxID=37928 RepID=A0A1H1G9J3_9MICC|nr:stealth family protein [Arthrobacter crystallopoietes]AUI52703.1 hypothetical protein AC20117_19800 [Arthrobacter crystallopoietes]SDR09496.1 Stealth protein CR3, conserved region 3 [Arthrobacter crystallopoietes]
MTALKRRLARLRNQALRLMSTNVSYYRRHRAQNDSLYRTGSAFMPMLARIDTNLRIPEQRHRALSLLQQLLNKAEIDFWMLPVRSDRPNIVCVDSRKRESIFSLLRQQPDFSGWYLEPLSPRGKSYGQVQIIGQSLRATQATGVRIYELVKAERSSTFSTTPLQGVEIHFWKRDESGLNSLVWNDRVVELTSSDTDLQPDEEIRSAQSKATHDVSFPIDIVYTWVDGADPEWLKRKASALQIHDPELFTDSAIDAARFADHDELRYSLRSIEQFAPWVRKIWIVTAGQTPPWLDTSNPRIHVVDHEDIWPSPEGLPTFNSHAIEANLHRIPGLADYYLYFNDDVLLGRPIAPELFFHPNGITKFFHSRALVDFGPTLPGENASTTAAKNARGLIQQAFGMTFSRKFYHVPAPISRRIMNQAEERFSEAFQRTRASSFRAATDIAPSGSMYLNYAYAAGHAVPGSIRYDYIDPATIDGRKRMEDVIRRRHLDVICVNDGATEQSLEEREETDRYIRLALARMLPVKSSFEL